MCLGVPGRVVAVDGSVAVVDFFGLRRPVLLDDLGEPVTAGDYVVSHLGFAVGKISGSEAEAMLAPPGREPE